MDHAHLLLTDRDSLMYEVERAHIYADMLSARELYDLSNYPLTLRKYKAHFVLNGAKVGLMKDVVAGSAIQDIVRLRPKIYSFLVAQNNADGT